MTDRRQFFLKFFGSVAALIALLKGGSASAKKLALPVDKVKGMDKVGSFATVKLSGHEILLIRVSESEIKAVSPKCTHQGCPLKYNSKTAKLDCGCHGASFDLDGKVLKGPAQKNLKTYPSTLKDGRIVISVD